MCRRDKSVQEGALVNFGEGLFYSFLNPVVGVVFVN